MKDEKPVWCFWSSFVIREKGHPLNNFSKDSRWVRHRDRRSSTPAYPGCWAMGTFKVKNCTVRKIIFCIGLTRAAKTGQKSIVPARRVQRANQGRIHFCCTLWVPIHLSFNSQQGPPVSSLSGSAAIVYTLRPLSLINARLFSIWWEKRKSCGTLPILHRKLYAHSMFVDSGI